MPVRAHGARGYGAHLVHEDATVSLREEGQLPKEAVPKDQQVVEIQLALLPQHALVALVRERDGSALRGNTRGSLCAEAKRERATEGVGSVTQTRRMRGLCAARIRRRR